MEGKKTVLITGATRGLGRALVEGFVARGDTVIGCGRSESRVAELHATHGEPHHFKALDVSSDHAVAAWSEEVLKDLGSPDLLLNNAGLINRPAPLWELAADEVDELLAVNLSGPIHLMRHFLPAIIERGSGIVINFSSGWGRSTSPDVAPYCASKWGIEGLCQATASELPAGIAVAALNPGIIDTEMLRTTWGEQAGQFPNPTSWARQAVPYLAGLDASCNGRPLTVPGG